MKSQTLFASIIVAAVAAPLSAHAQGVPGGFAHGANEGYRVAGPIGAIVGAPVGGVIGGIEGLLGIGPAYRDGLVRVQHRRAIRRHAKSRRHMRRGTVVR